MKKFAFAALAISVTIWGTAAGTLREFPHGQPATEQADTASDWSISETGAAPGWSITPAHAHMW